MIQLEDTLAQVRKEYEMLRIEFEQTLAANEQAGMIILASRCSLLQMPSLNNTVWLPGLVRIKWSSDVLKTLKPNPGIHFGSQLGACFSQLRLASFVFFF